jgi:hypothetical protein
VIFLAGPIAEIKWRKCSRTAIGLIGRDMVDLCLNDPAPEPETDLGQVRTRLAWGSPGEEREKFARAWAEADDLVAENCGAIQAIGRELAAKGRLSHEELEHSWQVRKRAKKG